MTWDNLHEEDVLFEFRGKQPDELTPGRFYLGEVDGFAEFGVFVSLNSSVTGLLHRSKLDRRLESLDWDDGEEVIVQVEGVRDNGNVDLDWSIRQSPDEFRGDGVDDPGESAHPENGAASGELSANTRPEPEPEESKNVAEEPVKESSTGQQVVEAVARASTDELAELTGERVRLEGVITEIRQTSGPTVFTIADEGGQVECAAFESAGVRAYPDVETDDVVRLVGVVEHHRGDVQIETESIEGLDETDRERVLESIETAASERAEPDDTSLLIDDPVLAKLEDDMAAVATQARRAALASRTIVIRHPPTVDGVVGGAAIEWSIRSAIQAERSAAEIDDRLVRRRPMRDPWYDLGDAMYDLGADPDAESPLVILVGAGTTAQDRDALEFLDLYDASRLVIDASARAASVSEVTNASAVGDETRSAATMAVHVAGMIGESVRDELAPLPAISYRGPAPEAYRVLAADHGVEEETIRERHQALSLIAYHQRYDDKRELVADLLFDGEEAARLAGHVSTQYRTRVGEAVETAQANCDRLTVVNGAISVLDADEHVHRFDFPPKWTLAEELLAAEAEDHDVDVVVILGTDEAHLASREDLDLGAISTRLEEQLPEAAIDLPRDQLTFLAGQRSAVRSALVDALADQLA